MLRGPTHLGVVLPLAAAVLAAAGARAQVPPAAHWRFEEGAGPALDASGNGNTGTIVGATYSGVAPWMALPNATSLELDAKADQVEIAAGAATNLHVFPNGITVEAIVQVDEIPIPPDAVGQRIAYVFWADDGTADLLLLSTVAGATTLRGQVNGVGGVSGPCTTTVQTAFVWPYTAVHVAMRYADELLELYVDGKLVDSAPAPGGCGSAVGPVGSRDIMRIGNDETAVGFPSNDRAFRGHIDEVRITAEALDPSLFLRPQPNTLYVGAWSGNRLLRYDWPAATLLGSTTGLNDPRIVARGPDGELYVAIEDDMRIDRFTAQSGAALGPFATGPPLGYTYSLTFGPDGDLYATSDATEIHRFDGATGAFVGVFSSVPELIATRMIAFGPDGNLYVSVSPAPGVITVVRLDAQTGAYIDTFTSGGPAIGETLGMVFGPDGHLYVGSIQFLPTRGGISRFDGLTGAYLDEFVTPGAGGLELPAELEFGPEGDLYVADFLGRSVLVFDGQTGAFDGTFVDTGSQINGIEFVPEPEVLPMLAAGAVFLALASRRRRCGN